MDDKVFRDSELVMGLVGPVGTDLKFVEDKIKEKLNHFDYTSRTIKISKQIIEKFSPEYNITRVQLLPQSYLEVVFMDLLLFHIGKCISSDSMWIPPSPPY